MELTKLKLRVLELETELENDDSDLELNPRNEWAGGIDKRGSTRRSSGFIRNLKELLYFARDSGASAEKVGDALKGLDDPTMNFLENGTLVSPTTASFKASVQARLGRLEALYTNADNTVDPETQGSTNMLRATVSYAAAGNLVNNPTQERTPIMIRRLVGTDESGNIGLSTDESGTIGLQEKELDAIEKDNESLRLQQEWLDQQRAETAAESDVKLDVQEETEAQRAARIQRMTQKKLEELYGRGQDVPDVQPETSTKRDGRIQRRESEEERAARIQRMTQQKLKELYTRPDDVLDAAADTDPQKKDDTLLESGQVSIIDKLDGTKFAIGSSVCVNSSKSKNHNKTGKILEFNESKQKWKVLYDGGGKGMWKQSKLRLLGNLEIVAGSAGELDQINNLNKAIE